MVAFWTLFIRELSRFSKVLIQTVVTPFISSFLYLLIFGVSLGSHVSTPTGTPYLVFLIPGLMMMGLMNNAFQNSSSSIVSSKFSGDLEDLRVVPITNQQIVWALSFGGLVRGVIVGVITFVVGALFYYSQSGLFLSVAHPWAVVFFMVVAGLLFSQIGIAVAFWAKTFDQLSAFSAFILLPLTYLGGVFISIQQLHPFWQLVSRLNPLLYLINGLRYGMLGFSDVDLSLAVLISLVGLGLCYLIAFYSVKHSSFQRW